MALPSKTPTQCLVGERSDYPDPFTRGLAYLQQIQTLTLYPDLINRMGPPEQIAVCTWIGLHIDTVNAELQACLRATQDCFHDWQQRSVSVQVFAAPFCQVYGMDGVCNLHTQPITLLIDAGRVLPPDWLGLVAHEYAHAYVGSPGHGRQFFKALSHLCLGLDLASPPSTAQPERLCHWPPSRINSDPIAFWRGRHWPCSLPMTEYYARLETIG